MLDFETLLPGLEDFKKSLSLELRKKDLQSLLDFQCDHFCFRTDSIQTYKQIVANLSAIAELLTEAPVGGRPIATFRLPVPLKWENQNIFLVEVPAPKAGRHYEAGWEHAEFVVPETLWNNLSQSFPNQKWEFKGKVGDLNPEASTSLTSSMAIKCHLRALDVVIKLEQSL